MNKTLLAKLEEKGFRQTDEREEYVYFTFLLKSIFDDEQIRKEKEKQISRMKNVRKELGLSVKDLIVPIDFEIPGD